MICACCKEFKKAGRRYPMTAAGLCAECVLWEPAEDVEQEVDGFLWNYGERWCNKTTSRRTERFDHAA